VKPACVSLRRILHGFRSDQRAAVAILFALALVPLVTAVGAAVDYSRASSARDKLTMIADGAALEAISKAALLTRRKLPDHGKANTETLFREWASSLPDVALTGLTVLINQSEASRNVTIEYTADVRNYFGSFLNGQTTAVAGKAIASASMTFIDFFLLLDNSPSMGLGATLSDIAKMKEATKNVPQVDWRNCEFACHQVGQPNDHYAIARNANVTLRIDVVRQATQRLIDRADAMEVGDDQFRVAIFTFNRFIQQISPLTGDLPAARTAAQNIQLVPLPAPPNHNDYRYTYFSGLNPAAIPAGGTGESSSSRKAIVFLVTDGVADEAGSPRVKTVPVELCTQLKAKNILIAALYTTYFPIPDNDAYKTLVAPIVNDIAPAIQACASPGLYFEVSPTQGITEAMEALLDKAVKQAHLTH
jgi:Flp pilus assembly protein TadG